MRCSALNSSLRAGTRTPSVRRHALVVHAKPAAVEHPRDGGVRYGVVGKGRLKLFGLGGLKLLKHLGNAARGRSGRCLGLYVGKQPHAPYASVSPCGP